MSKRPMVALAATAALSAGALVAAAPGSAQSHHARATGGATTVIVIEHAITDKEIRLAPGGPDEKGDILTFNNPVFNPADTTKVGHDEGFCTRIAPKPGIWECLWTTFVDGGQITVQGPFYDKRNSVLSITGGTGTLKGARGQMGLTSLDGGRKYRFTFRLS